MITLINENLFNFKVVNERIDENTSQVRLLITNTDKVKQPPAKDNYETSDNDGLGLYEPLIKILAKVTAPRIDHEFYNKYEDCDGVVPASDIDIDYPAMAFRVNEANEIKKVPTIDIKFFEEAKEEYVDRHIYILAVPFNGIMKSLPETIQYRIYKGCLVYSPLPIYFKKKSYKKILYLVFEPNASLFKEDHKYHTDQINIDFASYYSYNEPKTNLNKTDKQVYHLSFTKDGYFDSWENETLDGFIAPLSSPGTQLWVTYSSKKNKRFSNNKKFNNSNDKNYKPYNNQNNKNNFKENNNNNDNKNTNRVNKTNNSNNKKHAYVENDTLITTNKHGIRKEVSLNKNNRKNNNSIKTTNGYRNNNYNNSKPSGSRVKYIKDGE